MLKKTEGKKRQNATKLKQNDERDFLFCAEENPHCNLYLQYVNI